MAAICRLVTYTQHIVDFVRMSLSVQDSFLKCTLDPEHGDVMPPLGDNGAAISKDTTVYGSISGDASVNGALLWLPERSAASIVPLVPMGSAVAVESADNEAITPSWSLSEATIFSPNQWLVTCEPGYFLPSELSVIKVNPDLATDFDRVRPFAGVLRVQSATTSTTSAAISGVMHAASVADLRGMRKLDPAMLDQDTPSKKDCVLAVPCAIGVVAIQASDISSDFVPPKAQFTRDDGKAGLSEPVVGPMVTWVVGDPANMRWPVQWLLAPGISITNLTNATGSTDVAYVKSLSNENDFPWMESVDADILVRFPTGRWYPNSQIVVTDIWGAGGPDASGNIELHTWTTTAVHPVTCQLTTIGNGALKGNYYNAQIGPGAGDFQYQYQRIEHRSLHNTPAIQTQLNQAYGVPIRKIPERAFWIGMAITYPMPMPGDADVVGSNNVQCIYQFGARSLYRTGCVGPARFLMWENLAPGQNVAVKGKLRAQVIATKKNASLLSTQRNVGSTNASLLPYITMLFNGDSPIAKRVFNGEAYDDLVSSLRHNPIQTLAAVATNGISTEHAVEGKSAGLFGSLLGGPMSMLQNLAGSMGGSLGKLVNMGNVGNAIQEHGIPYLAQQLGGGGTAAGMFGYNGESAGMFGQAAPPGHYRRY